MGRLTAPGPLAAHRQRLLTTFVIASCSNLTYAFLSSPRLALRTPQQKLCSSVSTALNKAPLLGLGKFPRATRGLSSIRASAPTASKTDVKARVGVLRERLNDAGVDAMLVMSADAHQSEYVADRDQAIKYLSGFSGSAGTVLVSKDGATLVTDGRYTIQAAMQLDAAAWEVRQVGARLPTMSEHLSAALATPHRIGVDASTVTPAPPTPPPPCPPGAQARGPGPHPTGGQVPVSTWRTLNATLTTHTLVPLEENPIFAMWEAEGRPARPAAPVRPHPLEFAGASAGEKLAELRAKVAKAGADAIVVSMLDEVAWALNVRGADVDYNPVTIAHLVVTKDETLLFIDEGKVQDADTKSHLADAGVALRAYDSFLPAVRDLAAKGSRFMLDPTKTSWAVFSAIEEGAPGAEVVEKNSPIAAPKARKNAAERAGLQAAHVRDGVAMAKFLCWIEAAVAGGEAVTEISAAAKAEEFRAQQGRFAGLSFPTISASGPNGAITHYGVSEETSRALTADEMFLCDSGAQYLDGTTDVTRTIHFAAEPPAEQRRCFTRVMQGHIALADARFVPGTTGFQLDVLARQPLWRDGLAYAHGTGHGVGAYLGVHEGPHSISFSQRPPDAAIEPGFTTSIEPGYYLEGRFGIRIENIMLTVAETLTPPAGPALDVLRFEPLTLIPFQRRLLDTALLAPHEVAYLDAYHARVWREVSPALAAGPHACANTLDWLREATRPLA